MTGENRGSTGLKSRDQWSHRVSHPCSVALGSSSLSDFRPPATFLAISSPNLLRKVVLLFAESKIGL
ncbi:hypothetical protein H6P81_004217 [Aristolochia fimbriata]|uniref:Uncharacterized protein n=1 Tax=Aristolochia fimbriata TaxID=158543 RepID=A0AAV7FGH6_ARIFI|nr:hypothetical protein H6P81_004217 [Aristolochia fimbriata]